MEEAKQASAKKVIKEVKVVVEEIEEVDPTIYDEVEYVEETETLPEEETTEIAITDEWDVNSDPRVIAARQAATKKIEITKKEAEKEVEMTRIEIERRNAEVAKVLAEIENETNITIETIEADKVKAIAELKGTTVVNKVVPSIVVEEWELSDDDDSYMDCENCANWNNGWCKVRKVNGVKKNDHCNKFSEVVIDVKDTGVKSNENDTVSDVVVEYLDNDYMSGEEDHDYYMSDEEIHNDWKSAKEFDNDCISIEELVAEYGDFC
jgi:hypothetical protein